MARHLFIVSKEKEWLFHYLVDRFADDPKVSVILNRRVGERRLTQRPPQVERRTTERRMRRDPEEDDLLTQGFFIVDL